MSRNSRLGKVVGVTGAKGSANVPSSVAQLGLQLAFRQQDGLAAGDSGRNDNGDQLAEAQYLLKRLVSEQKPVGDYAATVARDGGRPQVYFAFDDESDAKKFAAAFEAASTVKYPGWASQCAFEVDGVKLSELEASLPVPRRRERKAPPDGSSLRFLRRPRITIKRFEDD
jgi:hypothetical protein